MKKITLTILIVVLMFVCLSGCFHKQGLHQQEAGKPVIIGGSLGLTGKYDQVGNLQLKAYRLWEEEINKKGGLLGRPVKIVIYDDESDKNKAISIYQRLITEEKVDLIFGPYSSGITKAVAPVVEKYGYPMVASASSDSIWQNNYKYIIGIWTPASRYIRGFLELLVYKGINNIAIVSADDPFSVSLSDGAKMCGGRFNLNVVLFERFKKGTKDLSYLAEKVKASKSEVLIVCGHYNEAVIMRRAIKKVQYSPRAYFATVGPTFSRYYDDLGKDAECSFSSSQWENHPDLKLPGIKKFSQAFIAKYDVDPSYHAATAYAAGQLLEQAVNRSQSFDRVKLMETYYKMDTSTILGRYGIGSTGIQVKKFPLIIQCLNGKREIIWPQDLKTASAVFK